MIIDSSRDPLTISDYTCTYVHFSKLSEESAVFTEDLTSSNTFFWLFYVFWADALNSLMAVHRRITAP